jgi:small GTP-binding protein
VRVVATAGHVDHGKSTLVQALTGRDPDRLAEEKARGLTIDLGFAWTTLGRTEVAFVDVPGHARFIKNMLAGAGAVDACLFVVAATEGWKPQSEEHLRILELLGVAHGVIALTKVGLVDHDRRRAARDEVAHRTAGTFLGGAPIVEVDAVAGLGLDDLARAIEALAATPGPWNGHTTRSGPVAASPPTSPASPHRTHPGVTPSSAPTSGAPPVRPTPPSKCWRPSTTRSPAGAPTPPTWAAAATGSRSACSAGSGR